MDTDEGYQETEPNLDAKNIEYEEIHLVFDHRLLVSSFLSIHHQFSLFSSVAYEPYDPLSIFQY